MNIFSALIIPFLLLALPVLSRAETVRLLNLDGCMSCPVEAGKAGRECLEQLEKLDLLFLSGSRRTRDWTVDEKTLLTLCKRVKNGDRTALEIGFRLVVVLNGESEERLIEALGKSMENEPGQFLIVLQGVIDFARRGNQAGSVKKSLWDDFISSDLGYGDKLEQQIAAARKRREEIQEVDDLSVKEAKAYVLDMLDEKIQDL